MPLPRLPASELAAEMARISAARTPPAAAPRMQARRFEGATHDRLTSDWLATSDLIDAEIRSDLDALRRRSRELAQNNDYVKSFLRAVRRNIVGPNGPTLQAGVMDPGGQPDRLANQALEAAWLEQCLPANFEVTGKHSAASAFGIMATALARDGETLFRVIRKNGYGKFGFQVQLLDTARIATTLNREPTPGSTAIRMGVEVNEYGKPLALHVHTGSPTLGLLTGSTERIPIQELRHVFFAEHPEQTRGVPWIHAAMKGLHNLRGYRDAAIIAARVGASQMGFFVNKDGDPAPVADDVVREGEPAGAPAGDFTMSVEPGQFRSIPAGYELQNFDPEYPHAQFDAFNKAILRGIAAGFGVAYHTMTGDLEGVNFSSIRAGVLDERDEWMFLQGLFRDLILTPLYEEWLEWALLRGQIVQAGGSPLPAAKLWKFRAHMWQMKRWAWVDPLKDIRAGIEAIEARLASPQQIAAQAGRDIEDVLDDIAAFQTLAAAKGVALSPIAGTLAPLPPG